MSENQAVFAWIATALASIVTLLVAAWTKHVNTRLEKQDKQYGKIDRRLFRIENKLGIEAHE